MSDVHNQGASGSIRVLEQHRAHKEDGRGNGMKKYKSLHTWERALSLSLVLGQSTSMVGMV